MSSRNDFAPFFFFSPLDLIYPLWLWIQRWERPPKVVSVQKAENNERKRGFNTGSYVFNTCHLWIWIMYRPFLTLSCPPTDLLYRKRLSIDGRQLNLEVFDPCSQVKHITNASFFCFMSCTSLMVSNHSVCLVCSWNECGEEHSTSFGWSIFSKNTHFFKFLI